MQLSTGDLATIVLATGALGTAAFGVVEGLKGVRWIGEAGFPKLKLLLGEELLRAQYRNGRGKGAIGRTLRQGIRIGLPEANTDKLAAELPGVDNAALKKAASVADSGKPPAEMERRALARFEMAIDARIDAALALAESRYVATARWAASGFTIIFALVVAKVLGDIPYLLAFVVGVAAVPIAPVAKDITKGLRSAEKALKVVG